MVEPFLWKKATDLSVTSLAKTTSSFLKGLAVTALICFMIYAAYITLVKPHFNPIRTEETIQTAQQIQNIEHHYSVPDEQFFIGIKLLGFKLGLVKDKRVEKEVKNINIEK